MFEGGFEVLKLQCFKLLRVLPLSEAYSEPSKTFEIELFGKSRELFLQKDSS